MMTLKFSFSPFTLHLGDTTPLPGETDDKYDVNDIAPSLIPVREFLDDHSWTSFILPNSFTSITDTAYDAVKPYNTPSSRGNSRDSLLPVFSPTPLGHDIIPFHIECPFTVTNLVSYFTTEGISTANTWICQNPLFVAWFNWVTIIFALTVEGTIFRTKRISTSYDTKCFYLFIQRIVLDIFMTLSLLRLLFIFRSSSNLLVTTFLLR